MSFAKDKLYKNIQTLQKAYAVEPSLITANHYWMRDYESDLQFELESNDWNNWYLEKDISTSVNSLSFTISALNSLHQFLNSGLINKLKYFSDYDKQSVEDAIYYLTDHEKLLTLMSQAKRMALREEDEEEPRVRFKMDANGNLTRIEE